MSGNGNRKGDGDDGQVGERWPSSTGHTATTPTTISCVTWLQCNSARAPEGVRWTAAGCQVFLLQLELYLGTVHPAPSGRESVNTLVSCLSGKALEWSGMMETRQGTTTQSSPAAFGSVRPPTGGPSGG